MDRAARALCLATADTIEALAWSQDEGGRAGFTFSMHATGYECGTPACIAGWLAWQAYQREILLHRAWETEGSIHVMDTSATLLGLDDEEKSSLFNPATWTVGGADFEIDVRDRPGEPGHISPRHAAACLRNLARTGKVDWEGTRPGGQEIEGLGARWRKLGRLVLERLGLRKEEPGPVEESEEASQESGRRHRRRVAARRRASGYTLNAERRSPVMGASRSGPASSAWQRARGRGQRSSSADPARHAESVGSGSGPQPPVSMLRGVGEAAVRPGSPGLHAPLLGAPVGGGGAR